MRCELDDLPSGKEESQTIQESGVVRYLITERAEKMTGL